MSQLVISWGFVEDSAGRPWSYWIYEDGVVGIEPEHSELPYPIEFSRETLAGLAEHAGDQVLSFVQDRKRRPR